MILKLCVMQPQRLSFRVKGEITPVILQCNSLIFVNVSSAILRLRSGGHKMRIRIGTKI